jgi:hypothetical protein
MEKEKSHALEMGKEKKEAHEETAEETGRRAVAPPEKNYFFFFINFSYSFLLVSIGRPE